MSLKFRSSVSTNSLDSVSSFDSISSNSSENSNQVYIKDKQKLIKINNNIIIKGNNGSKPCKVKTELNKKQKINARNIDALSKRWLTGTLYTNYK